VSRVALGALLVGGLVAFLVWRSNREPPAAPPRRPALALEAATPADRAAYFFDLLDSASTWKVGSWSAPVGRVLGRPGLIQGGAASLDELLAEERYPGYRRSTNRLLTLLALLADFPHARQHPRMEPFLRHWLDPENCPPDIPGARPAEEFRKRIFHLFRVDPPDWAAPYCADELTRPDRFHDLRVEALGVLLYLGVTEPIVAHWAELPPTEDEPQPLLKPFVLSQMRIQAAPHQAAPRREGARKLEPLARRTLKDGALYERVNAASALLRLGDAAMADRLIEFAELARAQDDVDTLWSALTILVEDVPDPRARAMCLNEVADDVRVGDYPDRTALKILAAGWPEDPLVARKLWEYVDRAGLSDLSALRWVLRTPDSRGRVVEILRTAIRDGSFDDRWAAVRFATTAGNAVPEVMPDLYRVARETPADRGRTRYLNALVTMRFDEVKPLLLADLTDDLVELRRAAAANLLELDTEETVEAVAARLEGGDLAMLDPIVARAQARGKDGVPLRLLPALLHALRTAPGEDDRFRALYALRCQGRLAELDGGLMDAYRREPSERVADAIAETLRELAIRQTSAD